MVPVARVSLVLGLFVAPQAAAQVPADTYFSVAVAENSHNHSGARLLFLDFQEAPFTTPDAARGEVAAVEVAPGAVVLDGDAGEWDPTYLTAVTGLVQNNYPLSEYLDALQTPITIGAAWDAANVYFVVQWEDRGHSASTRLGKWIFGDQGVGLSGWNEQRNVGAVAGTPNAAAVNAGHVLAGHENEDRVFLMFPIVDGEQNFTPGGAGCALYCHANLADDDPNQDYTGAGVAVMRTNLPGDTADIWHWKASRTEPSGYADDKWIEYGVGSENGRRNDAGLPAYASNGLVGGHPASMHSSGLGFTGDALLDVDAIPFVGAPLAGQEIPRNVSRQPAESRADVATSASFDPVTHRWTVEFQRKRFTGNADDHSFEGAPASPPTVALVTAVDPVAGAQVYGQECAGCHSPAGEGFGTSLHWIIPRVQRTSGSHILEALLDVPSMGSIAQFVDDQDIEDIAAFLQQQATFEFPAFVDPTPRDHVVRAHAGSPLTFTVSAVDIEPGEVVDLTATGIPAGAAFVPPLPASGNPASATFSWTPTNADEGQHVLQLTATDGGGLATVTSVTIEVFPECYVVLGDGASTVTPFTPDQHTFHPQVGAVLESFPVFAGDVVELPIPELTSTPTSRGFQYRDDFLDPAGQVELFVQVLAWSPDTFPQRPEQWSRALDVTVLPDGRVHARRHGTTTGVQIRAQVGVDAQGHRVLRFPFVVPGL